ncbi:MAG: hypothetical protein Q9209_001679 [Squamulea sp. 1 TL-2023]
MPERTKTVPAAEFREDEYRKKQDSKEHEKPGVAAGNTKIIESAAVSISGLQQTHSRDNSSSRERFNELGKNSDGAVKGEGEHAVSAAAVLAKTRQAITGKSTIVDKYERATESEGSNHDSLGTSPREASKSAFIFKSEPRQSKNGENLKDLDKTTFPDDGWVFVPSLKNDIGEDALAVAQHMKNRGPNGDAFRTKSSERITGNEERKTKGKVSRENNQTLIPATAIRGGDLSSGTDDCGKSSPVVELEQPRFDSPVQSKGQVVPKLEQLEEQVSVDYWKSLPLLRRWKAKLEYMYRPRVQDGYHRIEWICDCGKAMYWDVKGISPTKALNLTCYLRGNTTTPAPAFSEPQQGGNVQQLQASVPPPTPGQTHQSLPPRPNPPSPSNTYTPQAPSSLPVLSVFEPRFLELCVNTGRFARNVSETNISRVGSDGELFELVADSYYKTRAARGFLHLRAPQAVSRLWGKHKLRWSFLQPTSILFRKVVSLDFFFLEP